MADGTRVKELQESHKKLELQLQAETRNRSVLEDQIKEQFKSLDQKIDTKYDQLAKSVEELKLLMMGSNKGKETTSTSLLGPSPFTVRKEGNPNSRSSPFTSGFKTDYSHQSGSNPGYSNHRVDFPKFDGTNP